MKRNMLILIIGVALIIAAIGTYLVIASNIGVKEIKLSPNSEKDIHYTLSSGNYTLLIKTDKKIHYIFTNSTNIIAEGNITDHIVKNIHLVKDTYTLKIKNLENKTATVIISLKSSKSLVSLGIQVLGSGVICLIGIILTIIGTWLLLKSRKIGRERKNGY